MNNQLGNGGTQWALKSIQPQANSYYAQQAQNGMMSQGQAQQAQGAFQNYLNLAAAQNWNLTQGQVNAFNPTARTQTPIRYNGGGGGGNSWIQSESPQQQTGGGGQMPQWFSSGQLMPNNTAPASQGTMNYGAYNPPTIQYQQPQQSQYSPPNLTGLYSQPQQGKYDSTYDWDNGIQSGNGITPMAYVPERSGSWLQGYDGQPSNTNFIPNGQSPIF